MSRIHPNQQRTDFETYLSTMLKNGKRVDKPSPRNEMGRLVRDKNTTSNNNAQLVVQSRPVLKAGSKNEELRTNPSDDELVHKEVFNNNMATVEVTVRTVASKGSAPEKCISEEKREPWAKLLNRKSDENFHGSFGKFDPLRTLHFLSKELQMRLQSLCPNDSNIHQIVNDMENAIHRLPPDVLSQLKPNMFSGDTIDLEMPINIKKSSHNIIKSEAQTQTVIVGDGDTKKIQKQLEDSANKLEASCKEMEDLCNKLRCERDELETMLQDERATVISLRQELAVAITEKDAKTKKEINKILSERDILRAHIEDLKIQLDAKETQTTEELRNLIESLKNKQLNTEQENTSVRTEITLLKLEKDKTKVLLDCRDKQLKELRIELESIQQIVSTQLLEMRPKLTFSTTSSLSSASGIWNIPTSQRSQKYGSSIHELFMNNDVMRKVLLDKDLKMCDSIVSGTTMMGDATKMSKANIEDIQVIPQKEIKATSQLTLSEAGQSEIVLHSNQPSIQDMFAEIKRQAFMKIGSPLPSKSHIESKDSVSNANNYTSAVEIQEGESS